MHTSQKFVYSTKTTDDETSKFIHKYKNATNSGTIKKHLLKSRTLKEKSILVVAVVITWQDSKN